VSTIVEQLLVLALGIILGVAIADHHSLTQIGEMKGDLAVAKTRATIAEGTLDDVRKQLKQRNADLDAQRNLTKAALDQRDALQTKLDKAGQQRLTTTTRIAYETPDCADLARIPVCPALAQRLWGDARDDPVPDHQPQP